MSLQNLFESELTNLGSGGTGAVVVSESPRTLSCDVVEQNSLAVSFDRLRLETVELAAVGAPELEKIGKALAERLTYLMEPIAPIEIDAAACVVQLRSSPPQRDDDGRSYYELIVRKGGEISLTRFRKTNGDARQPISATVTREVLMRLVGDFCGVLG